MRGQTLRLDPRVQSNAEPAFEKAKSPSIHSLVGASNGKKVSEGPVSNPPERHMLLSGRQTIYRTSTNADRGASIEQAISGSFRAEIVGGTEHEECHFRLIIGDHFLLQQEYATCLLQQQY
jgi:hypothetical protein